MFNYSSYSKRKILTITGIKNNANEKNCSLERNSNKIYSGPTVTKKRLKESAQRYILDLKMRLKGKVV